MPNINFMSVRKAKIPRRRRSSEVYTDDLQELKRKSRYDAVANDASLGLHTHEGRVKSEQLDIAPTALAPTVAFRKAYEDEVECCTDGQATSEHESSELPEKTDDGLASPESDHTYSNYEVVVTVLSILSYVFDIGSDIYLAFVYYNDGDMWWFTLTVIFIIVPSLTITIFSFVWYLQDGGHQSYPLIWLPRIVLLFLQLGPLLRLIAFFFMI